MTIIITGVSSGIGHALTSHYLAQGHQVVGIGRRNTISHPDFTFFEKDLSETTDFSFLTAIVSASNELILINNAGVIGRIERISEQVQSDIIPTIQVNSIAPMLLCQCVLQHFPDTRPLTIVNISSGAGKRPIPGWASYCASKAALDLFSQTIYLEEKEKKRTLRVYSVAPGVVDTPMQEQIRRADPESFSAHASFLTLKEKNELTSVEKVVEKLVALLSKPYDGNVIYSLKE
ncbi:SDR family NAD(P)-dependent oxidoreductase [Crocinitomicaceae bacterium CZZ-1]|uniref:SDR family NAD(P)-dependent oxidoreductase n=1 Tax=Taishania pollutisoli TaxID=2766479 RepID=A0A8J6U2E8_9FLAO|nr:SDR family NAD(P)-dependent oxidoreductase [Taishania pollutisoli]MBC9812880.1 SDR family NAD(P)-dependent oxidoreductase [Taishania pollutisoli]MBX2949670.1 SDR family NAD(P)-dependent oxidoreductase [Crocinitomicaceae bacterium]NGF76089.1 SDR family NAD(P)-dependent oxidoreductase [Fluviicola sp. SGL-29]